MSYEIAKNNIVELLESFGLKRNISNKLIRDDYHNKYFSINSVEQKITNNIIGNYIFDIDIAIDINSTEAFDNAQIFFETIVKRLSELNYFMGFNKNPVLKQMDKNPKRLIGNLNFLIDNFYC